MALDITINITDTREEELIKLTDEHNTAFPNDILSVAQFLRQFVRSWLDISAQQRADSERLGLRAAYKLATTEEQAQVNAILDKYRNNVLAGGAQL